MYDVGTKLDKYPFVVLDAASLAAFIRSNVESTYTAIKNVLIVGFLN